MAVDAPFPSLGDDPWGGTIIPWAEQVRENVNELDQVVNEGRLSPDQLSATIGEAIAADVPAIVAPVAASSRLIPGLRFGFMGDSITNGSSAANFAYSYAPQACAMVGGLAARADSFTDAEPGQRTDQMDARFDVFLGRNPDAVVIMGGTNDALQGRTPAQYAASMTSMIQKAKTAGKPVIVCTVPPVSSGDAPATHRRIDAYNTWIRLHASSLGVEVADTFESLVDPATGYLVSAYDSGDGIHPNGLGHHRLGVAVAEAIRRTSPAGRRLITSKWAAGNLIQDPLVAGGTVRPAGFFEWPGGTGTAPTYSIVDDTSGLLGAGRWSQIDFDGTASGGVRTMSSPQYTTGFAAGDRVAIVAQIQIDDVSGDWVENVVAGTAAARLTLVNQSGAGVQGGATFSRCPGISTADGVYNIGPTFYTFTIPGGTTALNMWYSLTVPTGSHYRLRVGALGVLNLTSLGLDAADLAGFSNLFETY